VTYYVRYGEREEGWSSAAQIACHRDRALKASPSFLAFVK
jgi:hypothetical protein